MESNIIQAGNANELNALSYTDAAAQFEKEIPDASELSCSLLLKNLLLTNLKLLKLNEISAVILF